MNARLYDPIVGRFISPDSIIPDEYDLNGMNRLSYVRNNPLIYTDPTGNSWLSNKLKKLKKKAKKRLKKAIENFSIDDVKRFAGTVNDNKWMPTSGEILNAPGATAIDIMDGAVQYTLVEPGTTIMFALDSSMYAFKEANDALIDVAGQTVDYCEENPLSCAATAATFVPGGAVLAYGLTAYNTLNTYVECEYNSKSAKKTTECQQGALLSGATSAALIAISPAQEARKALGIKYVLTTGDKVAVASTASILYLASESKEKEQERNRK